MDRAESQPHAEPSPDEATVTGELNAELAPTLARRGDAAQVGESHYQLEGVLGSGAMGEIWLAKDAGLHRQVAFKRMHAHIASHPHAMSRFLREMQITAQLDHPNIVPVYECELHADGSLAYAMKLIKGRTLKDLLVAKKAICDAGGQPGPDLSLARLLEAFVSVCEAMAFAHGKGVIHRDLKPVNLMIGEYGEVYVMDWGIARRIAGDGEEPGLAATQLAQDVSVDETQAGQILGTPRYMSPQQAAGKNAELDGRSDQFSLGLILFEILTLQPAFTAATPLELIKKVLKVELRPLVAYAGEPPIPRELAAIVRKTLARRPEGRYPSVNELIDDLRRWQLGLEVAAAPDTPLQKAGRWVGQHRSLALASLLGLFLLMAAAVSVALYSQQAALAQERAHSARLNARFNLVARQAQRIDSHFLTMQGLLSRVAGAASQALAQAPPTAGPIYPQHPFVAPHQFTARLFGGRISLDGPTSGFVAGKGPADMHGKLQRLLPLDHTFRQVLLRSAGVDPARMTPAQAQKLIGETGTPIMWVHVTLEEGVIYMFPGIGYTTRGYDPRTRPFYTLSAHKHGIFWGSPYFDPLSGALLPCTTALYDAEGRFQGVAGIDLRFQYVIDHLLTLPGTRFRSFLVNERGEIIIRSDEARKTATGSLSQGFETPAFPDPGLQQAIRRQQQGGYFEQGEQMLIYSRIESLGWYLVAQGPLSAEVRP